MKAISARMESAYNLALLFYLLSFFGWCGETILFLNMWGRILDRGFLTLPLCTIYGSTVILTYALFGTPQDGRLRSLFQRTADLPAERRVCLNILLYLLYFLLVMIPPTALELFVGVVFSRGLNNPLWDYGYHTFQLCGSICVSQTLLWGLLLTVGMSLLWKPLYTLADRVPARVKQKIVWILTVLVVLDFIVNFIFLLTQGHALHLYGIEKNVF